MGLRARRGDSVVPGRLSPCDELVVRGVLRDLGELLVTVARWVFELHADCTGCAAEPGHFNGRERPLRRPGHTRQLLVSVLVAGRAFHAGRSVIVRAPEGGRIVDASFVALHGRVARRMAIFAARMEHHARSFEKECACTAISIRDVGEVLGRLERVRGRRGGGSGRVGGGLPRLHGLLAGAGERHRRRDREATRPDLPECPTRPRPRAMISTLN